MVVIVTESTGSAYLFSVDFEAAARSTRFAALTNYYE
jgi:hypothetical protein